MSQVTTRVVYVLQWWWVAEKKWEDQEGHPVRADARTVMKKYAETDKTTKYRMVKRTITRKDTVLKEPTNG